MFTNRFNKTAKKKDSDKASHDNVGAVKDALVCLIPFGTTISTSAGKRPEGHSRSGEWVGRIAGATGGAMLGAAATRGRSQGAITAGHALGEGLTSKYIRSHTKEKY